MARRRSHDSQPSVSLFPFLSILACVIGTLTLMLAALALGQMDTPEMAIADQLDTLQHRAAEKNKEIDNLEEQLATGQNSGERKRYTDAQAELIRLQNEIATLQAEEPTEQPDPNDLETVIDNSSLEDQMAQLEKDIDERQETVTQLEAELLKSESPLAATVMVRPGGTGQGRRPIFVECNATAAVIHGGDEPIFVSRNQLSRDTHFVELVRRVADSENKIIIFLIREDGLDTYLAAQRLARNGYARNGKLPIVGEGNIDLSSFE